MAMMIHRAFVVLALVVMPTAAAFAEKDCSKTGSGSAALKQVSESASPYTAGTRSMLRTMEYGPSHKNAFYPLPGMVTLTK
jgi:hypothetical protein